MKTRTFSPFRTEYQLLRDASFTLGAKKNEKQPTLFKSANNSTKKVAPKRLMIKGGLVNRNGNRVICGQYRSRADGNIFLQYSPGVCLLPSESSPPSLSPAP